MGFRTVVMLSNDQAHEWEKDAELGRKIAIAMNHANSADRKHLANVGGYGRVVECVHADSQTLAVLDGYTFFDDIAGKGWASGEDRKEVATKLVREAAKSLGYRLIKAQVK